MRETRNNVITIKKQQKNGLWHDDCILPKRKMLETASKPKGASKETTCTADSMRIIIGNNVEVA